VIQKLKVNKTELGSKTAKGGFANEKAVCEKFEAWDRDIEAQEWLKIMGYDLKKISSVKAIQIPVKIKKSELSEFDITDEIEYENFIKFKKADAQIKITIKMGEIVKIENISLKKANSNADYNQIDKRSVDNYQEMWNFDDEIALWLKFFTGELNPNKYLNLMPVKKFKDARRLFFNEMPERIQNKIIEFFEQNRIVIVSDILKGRGCLSTQWMLDKV